MNRAASALAKQRWAKRDIEKTCPFCERRFKGVREQTYCTPAHQNAAAARRFRERRRAPPRPPASPVDVALERAHALAEAEWARRDGDLAEAVRWEQIAAGIAASAEA